MMLLIFSIPPGFVKTRLFGATHNPAPEVPFPEMNLAFGAALETNSKIEDLAAPGSPTKRI